MIFCNKFVHITHFEKKNREKICKTFFRKSCRASLSNLSLILLKIYNSGWLKTFEQYYQKEVRTILNLTVEYLTKWPDLKFIWSEMSFLERYWQDANTNERQQLRRIVKSGQLELTGGSWVMTDEATPYLSSFTECRLRIVSVV